MQRREILATEKYSLAPARYTEASLVKKLEDLGIGRPSTYAPTISTIQQRQYVVKGDKTGEERTFTIDSLKGIKITQKLKKEMAGSEKGKLLPTDIGIVVNDFLMENFPNIMNYNFTADVEKKFDNIAEGKTEWTNWMKDFDKGFEPEVKEVLEARNQHKAGERNLETIQRPESQYSSRLAVLDQWYRLVLQKTKTSLSLPNCHQTRASKPSPWKRLWNSSSYQENSVIMKALL